MDAFRQPFRGRQACTDRPLILGHQTQSHRAPLPHLYRQPLCLWPLRSIVRALPTMDRPEQQPNDGEMQHAPRENPNKGFKLSCLSPIITFWLKYIPIALIGAGSVVLAAQVHAKESRKASMELGDRLALAAADVCEAFRPS